MRTIVKEAESINRPAVNLLQTYKRFITDYKQYKRNEANLHLKAEEAVIHGTEQRYN